MCQKNVIKTAKQYKLKFSCLYRSIVFRYRNHANVKNEFFISHTLRDTRVAWVLRKMQPINEFLAIKNKWILSVFILCLQKMRKCSPDRELRFWSDFIHRVFCFRLKIVYFWFAWRGWDKTTPSQVLSIRAISRYYS